RPWPTPRRATPGPTRSARPPTWTGTATPRSGSPPTSSPSPSIRGGAGAWWSGTTGPCRATWATCSPAGARPITPTCSTPPRPARCAARRPRGSSRSTRARCGSSTPGLERHLVYDRTRRPSLRIRLVPQGTTLDQLRRDGQDDLGGLPSDAHTWELDVEAGRAAVHLRREAQIGSGRIAVERTIEAAAG